jgi:hypothetical protein
MTSLPWAAQSAEGVGLVGWLFRRTAKERYPRGTVPDAAGPVLGQDWGSGPGPAYDPGHGDYGGAPAPARRRRRLSHFLPHLILLVGMGAAAVRADLIPGSGRSATDVTDPYAAVAAEPERTLVAQGVRFTLIGHRPLGEDVCTGVPACVTAVSARWAVAGTDLEGRSWMFVFADAEDADAAVAAVVADPDLVGEPPPAGWAATGGSPGRFLVLVRVGHPSGGDVSSDPVATEAAEALRIHSTDPAVKELIEDRR